MPSPAGERLARLSRVSIIRAAALTGRIGPDQLGTDGLSALLYRAGGCTPSKGIDARWPQLLLRRAERPVRTALADHTRSATRAWMSWTVNDVDSSKLVHKIYVSPATAALADALKTTFAVATDLGIPAWKVGADVAGLHRADKIVLYLPTEDAADQAAAALAEALSHAAPQGVPFTGQVGVTGIVSRGVDQGGTSWRALVCRSLAGALWDARAAAGSAAAPIAVADLAQERLVDLGFDVATWRPQPLVTGAVR